MKSFRKVLSFIMAFSMLCTSGVFVNAAESNSTLLTYTNEASYEISIPAEVAINVSTGIGEIEIAVTNTNLAYTERVFQSVDVSVSSSNYLDDTWNLVNIENSNDKITYTLKTEDGQEVFNNGVVLSAVEASSGIVYANLTSESKVGSYTDSLTFISKISDCPIQFSEVYSFSEGDNWTAFVFNRDGSAIFIDSTSEEAQLIPSEFGFIYVGERIYMSDTETGDLIFAGVVSIDGKVIDMTNSLGAVLAIDSVPSIYPEFGVSYYYFDNQYLDSYEYVFFENGGALMLFGGSYLLFPADSVHYVGNKVIINIAGVGVMAININDDKTINDGNFIISPGESLDLIIEGNALYSTDKTILHFYYWSQTFLSNFENFEVKDKTFKIPNTVKTILEDAFYDRNYLNSITIPISVTEIGEGAFDIENDNLVIYYEGSEEEWLQINGHDEIDIESMIFLG